MAGLEGKGMENGDVTAEVPEMAVVEMKVETGVTHRSQETIDRAEALKADGNQMLAGKQTRKAGVRVRALERLCVFKLVHFDLFAMFGQWARCV